METPGARLLPSTGRRACVAAMKLVLKADDRAESKARGSALSQTRFWPLPA